MLLNPVADQAQGFRSEWLKHLDNEVTGDGMNKYILVDGASSKKKASDYTAMMVIGLGTDENYYLLDVVRDRLNLKERGDALFALHRRWRPRRVGYEQYGQMADVEYLRDRMGRENYRFDIIQLSGNRLSKEDRIRRLIPIFEARRFFLPPKLLKRDYEGKLIDLVPAFVEEEYKPFPVALHDDMLDAASRIVDEEMNVVWPKPFIRRDDPYAAPRRHRISPWAA
jgi:predicted phage terminase large subunit-like protein